MHCAHQSVTMISKNIRDALLHNQMSWIANGFCNGSPFLGNIESAPEEVGTENVNFSKRRYIQLTRYVASLVFLKISGCTTSHIPI